MGTCSPDREQLSMLGLPPCVLHPRNILPAVGWDTWSQCAIQPERVPHGSPDSGAGDLPTAQLSHALGLLYWADGPARGLTVRRSVGNAPSGIDLHFDGSPPVRFRSGGVNRCLCRQLRH